MSDTTPTFQDFLFEMRQSVSKVYASSWLMDAMESQLKEQLLQDAAFLASLSPVARAAELTRRRLATLRNRWERNVAWRLRPDPPDQDGWS